MNENIQLFTCKGHCKCCEGQNSSQCDRNRSTGLHHRWANRPVSARTETTKLPAAAYQQSRTFSLNKWHKSIVRIVVFSLPHEYKLERFRRLSLGNFTVDRVSPADSCTFCKHHQSNAWRLDLSTATFHDRLWRQLQKCSAPRLRRLEAYRLTSPR